MSKSGSASEHIATEPLQEPVSQTPSSIQIGRKRRRSAQTKSGWGDLEQTDRDRSRQALRARARQLMLRRQKAALKSVPAVQDTKSDSKPQKHTMKSEEAWWSSGKLFDMWPRQVASFEAIDRAWRRWARSCSNEHTRRVQSSQSGEADNISSAKCDSSKAVEDPRPMSEQNSCFALAPPRLLVASFETSRNGRRRFAACGLDRLWRRVLRIPPRDRHVYEIIRQGCACHLYFDIEFKVVANPRVDGGAATALLLREARRLIPMVFGADKGRCSPEHVLELDSSRAGKFSRHAVVRLPSGAMFATNSHVGEFVLLLLRWLQARRDAAIREWCRRRATSDPQSVPSAGACASEAGSPGRSQAGDHPGEDDRIKDRIKDLELCSLWVEEEEDGSSGGAAGYHSASEGTGAAAADQGAAAQVTAGAVADRLIRSFGRRAFLADLAVYTRNRAMRLVLSSKFGKRAVLAPAGTNRFGVLVGADAGAGKEETSKTKQGSSSSSCATAAAAASAARGSLPAGSPATQDLKEGGRAHLVTPLVHTPSKERVQLLLAGEDPTTEAESIPWDSAIGAGDSAEDRGGPAAAAGEGSTHGSVAGALHDLSADHLYSLSADMLQREVDRTQSHRSALRGGRGRNAVDDADSVGGMSVEELEALADLAAEAEQELHEHGIDEKASGRIEGQGNQRGASVGMSGGASNEAGAQELSSDVDVDELMRLAASFEEDLPAGASGEDQQQMSTRASASSESSISDRAPGQAPKRENRQSSSQVEPSSQAGIASSGDRRSAPSLSQQTIDARDDSAGGKACEAGEAGAGAGAGAGAAQPFGLGLLGIRPVPGRSGRGGQPSQQVKPPSVAPAAPSAHPDVAQGSHDDLKGADDSRASGTASGIDTDSASVCSQSTAGSVSTMDSATQGTTQGTTKPFRRVIQAGSPEWEEQVFRACLVTDALPPVPLAGYLAGRATRVRRRAGGSDSDSESDAEGASQRAGGSYVPHASASSAHAAASVSDASDKPDEDADADALVKLAEQAEAGVDRAVPRQHPLTHQPLLYLWPPVHDTGPRPAPPDFEKGLPDASLSGALHSDAADASRSRARPDLTTAHARTAEQDQQLHASPHVRDPSMQDGSTHAPGSDGGYSACPILANLFDPARTQPEFGLGSGAGAAVGTQTGILRRAMHGVAGSALTDPLEPVADTASGSQGSQRIVRTRHTGRTLEGYGATSPYPQLDSFVIHVAGSNGGPRARIRQWRVLHDVVPQGTDAAASLCGVGGGGVSAAGAPQLVPRTVQYSMVGNRFCRRVGRQHKSNNVSYSVDLMHGTVVQMCTDVECRGFRSDRIAIPWELVPSVGGGALTIES